ncbi:TetR/AcrR family transcriptional regulator [Listeria welshimeri]|uniref:TetR/AcrR family transcriptional regulator n=1 Tax=Listeria welshimeri TaxID=1643 RepID=UPI00162824CF|nr:TetR/AcrR family transcriptional regulator [Listeria welshimeri]MBC1414453.1 TetR/AcrR family transcriptional regulator [Listeria welshimeri]MBC1470172.1 TetR/AcrR family transcriptional regulator [Listeria welshimeri]MBC1620547.1 TetR/AcrR family transcriptional regulator [Listeria welshimeri]MBC1659365.1 TetR/AcrR family transcriptional regulator [Listeria welshimeri]MBC1702844.1 TetR/AcrR family transcriptional regulator [Listeria welshimeri]
MNISKLDKKRKIAILNSALKEFTIKGYDEASTNVIAKEADISKALMFHYIGNKQELFLFIYDYFEEVLENEYYSKINLKEKDIFNRLRQSYLLQLELLEQYPWILEFDKLATETSSEEINKRILNSDKNRNVSECFNLFNDIDTTKFRNDLDIKKCIQFILWSNVGFTNEILEDIRNKGVQDSNNEQIISTLDGYFDELQKVFYTFKEEHKDG